MEAVRRQGRREQDGITPVRSGCRRLPERSEQAPGIVLADPDDGEHAFECVISGVKNGSQAVGLAEALLRADGPGHVSPPRF